MLDVNNLARVGRGLFLERLAVAEFESSWNKIHNWL